MEAAAAAAALAPQSPTSTAGDGGDGGYDGGGDRGFAHGREESAIAIDLGCTPPPTLP